MTRLPFVPAPTPRPSLPAAPWIRAALTLVLALGLSRRAGEAARAPAPAPAPARPFLAQPAGPLAPPAGLAPPAATGVLVGRSLQHDQSPPLHTLAPAGAPSRRSRPAAPEPAGGTGPTAPDPVVQRAFHPLAAPATLPGLSHAWASISGTGYSPPDPNGDVGPQHYIQAVNASFQIWTKSGVALYGPAPLNTLWSSFGGDCATRNDGDPVVLYDPLADRWLISQFTAVAPYTECVAVSATADPLGVWNRYSFLLSGEFNDYSEVRRVARRLLHDGQCGRRDAALCL